MKKRLKGFTLLECIVAMAILGISSALLVQAYSQLARVTRMSSAINNSVSLQMEDAENTGWAETKATGVKPKTLTTATTKRNFEITLDTTNLPSGTSAFAYNLDVAVYAVAPYNVNDTQVNNATDPGLEYRYIYFHG